MSKWIKLKRFWVGLLIVAAIALLSSCSGTRMLMQQAPLKPSPAPSLPPLMPPEATKEKIEHEIYGPMPILFQADITHQKIITRNVFTKGDSVSEWRVSAGYGGMSRPFHIVLIMNENTPNAPFIISQNFCPNTDVVPIDGVTPPETITFNCSGDGIMPNIFGYFFGRYITEHPYKMILERGYNMAVFYPSEFLPDSADLAPDIINSLLGSDADKTYGAIAIWAILSQWLAVELKETYKSEAIIAYGHSRYGKTALLATAYSQDIDGAIAHQSGTGGASLLRDGVGESIKSITDNYPHWFTSKFATYASQEETLSIDAHNLLTLISPRPLFLGNARRDVWSDPLGAFNAAQAASKAWEVSGARGMSAKRLDSFVPQDNMAYWLRPGTHGVVEEDWPAFLDFIDAHFKTE